MTTTAPQLPPRRAPEAEVFAVEFVRPVPPKYFLMRSIRLGPLVPAKLWLCDHDPADPENKLDRGRLSIYPRAIVAGEEVDPEFLQERMWAPADHWKYCQPVTEAEYEYRLLHMRWRQDHRPGDPTAYARTKLDPRQVPLPSFE